MQSELLKQKMCVRYAQFFGLSDADCWERLPDETRYFFAAMSYKQVIHPLLWFDMNKKDHSCRQAARYYNISRQTAWRMSNEIPADMGIAIKQMMSV